MAQVFYTPPEQLNTDSQRFLIPLQKLPKSTAYFIMSLIAISILLSALVAVVEQNSIVKNDGCFNKPRTLQYYKTGWKENMKFDFLLQNMTSENVSKLLYD